MRYAARLTIAILFLTCGCQRYGRKLFGVEERENPVIVYCEPGAVVADLDEPSDVVRVMVVDAMRARYCVVKAGDGGNAFVPLPFVNQKTGAQATYIQDRGMFTIYGLATALPMATRVRIEYVL